MVNKLRTKFLRRFQQNDNYLVYHINIHSENNYKQYTIIMYWVDFV